MFDPSDIEAKKDALIWSARRCFGVGRSVLVRRGGRHRAQLFML